MKTTIYELLGMIKDNKAPKTILFRGLQYEFDDVMNDYVSNNNNWLFDEYVITDILKDEVTILETTIIYNQDAENQKNASYIKQDANMQDDKIEKVDEPYESCIFKTDYEFATELEKKIIDNIELIRKKQDEIINKLNGE